MSSTTQGQLLPSTTPKFHFSPQISLGSIVFVVNTVLLLYLSDGVLYMCSVVVNPPYVKKI